MVDVWIYIAVLLICMVVGLALTLLLARRRQRYLNVGSLLLFNYTLTQPVSGIVHLLSPSATNRGFYDLLQRPAAELTSATIAAVLGLVGLAIGCVFLQRGVTTVDQSDRSFWLSGSDRWLVALLLLVILPLGATGLMVIRQVAEQSGLERIIVVDGGNARYAYLAQWTAWAISLAVLFLVAGRRSLGAVPTLLLTMVGVVLIAVVLRWTGGRSIIVLMGLPLLLVTVPRFRRLELPAVAIGFVALVLYASVLSQARLTGFAYQEVSYVSWLDWESGRFSMSGFAAREVAANGLLWGETFLNAILWTFGGFFNLFGIEGMTTGLRSSTMIAGAALLRSRDIYIVPGLTAELMLNFGLAGVLFGYLLLGWLAGKVDGALARSRNVLKRLALGFLGSVLVFRTIQADSAALPSFILYIGAPLFACWAASALMQAVLRRRRVMPAPRVDLPAAAPRRATAGGSPTPER